MSLVYFVSLIVLIALVAVAIFRRPQADEREPNIGIMQSPDLSAPVGTNITRDDHIDTEFAVLGFQQTSSVPLGSPVPDNVTDLSEYQNRRLDKPGLPSVTLTPSRPAKGKEVVVRYRGILKDSDGLTLHVGYGFNDWINIMDLPMSKERGFWKADFEVEGSTRLNICFTDANNNWDNNNGENWSYDIKL